jgi:group I intron endonuclease
LKADSQGSCPDERGNRNLSAFIFRHIKFGNMTGIYKIESNISNRIYIGSAINIIQRWKLHKKTLKKGTHHSIKLQRHYNKYGKKDLHFSVLLGCDKEELIKKEQFFIDSFNPYFNICKKAGSPLGVKHSIEYCKKLSEMRKGKLGGINNPMYGKHSTAGIRNGMYGKKHTDETKLKMRSRIVTDTERINKSNAHKGLKHSKETIEKILASRRKFYKNKKLQENF